MEGYKNLLGAVSFDFRRLLFLLPSLSFQPVIRYALFAARFVGRPARGLSCECWACRRHRFGNQEHCDLCELPCSLRPFERSRPSGGQAIHKDVCCDLQGREREWTLCCILCCIWSRVNLFRLSTTTSARVLWDNRLPPSPMTSARSAHSDTRRPSSVLRSLVSASPPLWTSGRFHSPNLLQLPRRSLFRRARRLSKWCTLAIPTWIVSTLWVHTEQLEVGNGIKTAAKVGADASCTKPICCRHYADKQGPITTPAGPFGHRHCDTPPALVQQLLKNIGADNKFSIFTGDLVEGAVWLVNREFVRFRPHVFDIALTVAPLLLMQWRYERHWAVCKRNGHPSEGSCLPRTRQSVRSMLFTPHVPRTMLIYGVFQRGCACQPLPQEFHR